MNVDTVYDYLEALAATDLEGDAAVVRVACGDGTDALEITVIHAGVLNRLYQRLRLELRDFGFSWDLQWIPVPGSGIYGRGMIRMYEPVTPGATVKRFT